VLPDGGTIAAYLGTTPPATQAPAICCGRVRSRVPRRAWKPGPS